MVSLKNKAAIVGIGQTEFSKNSGRSELQLAAEAVRAAILDAGLEPSDIDGTVTFTIDTNDELALMRELARSDVIRELAMTGRIFSGAEALAYGFATSLHADPLAAARSTAKEIATRNPEAVRAIKRLLNTAKDADAATILLAESKEQAALIGSPNQIEAVRAGMEGRPGRFAD